MPTTARIIANEQLKFHAQLSMDKVVQLRDQNMYTSYNGNEETIYIP